MTTGAYCYYANDSATYAAVYGKLYNWYAVNDSRGLAPEGWHVSTDFEWTTTADCLGGSGGAGGLMKEIGTTHWSSPNNGATNLSGFTALPGGDRYEGIFYDINYHGFWWSATESDTTNARARNINNSNFSLDVYIGSKLSGFSVRCIRD